MQIDRIGRDKSYEMVTPYGLKVWDKVSVSGTISPGEDIQQAYKELDRILEEAHQQALSGEEEMKGTHVRNVVEEQQDKIQSWITVINLCTSETALKRFETRVQEIDNQELTEAYNNKLQSLQKQ